MKHIKLITFLTVALLSVTACGTKKTSEEDHSSIFQESILEIEEDTQLIEEADYGAMIPMVMVNDTLYMTTGLESAFDGRCGVMDGEITSTVDGTKKPTQNGQSNFGTGYGYQYGSVDGTIELYLDERWIVFATEEIRLQYLENYTEPLSPIAELPLILDETVHYHGKDYKKSNLSDETVHWLELTYEERMYSSYYPVEFMD